MPEIVTVSSCGKKLFYLPAGDPYGKYFYFSEVMSTARGRLTYRRLLSFFKVSRLKVDSPKATNTFFFYAVLLLIKSNWQINSKRFGNCENTQSKKNSLNLSNLFKVRKISKSKHCIDKEQKKPFKCRCVVRIV